MRAQEQHVEGAIAHKLPLRRLVKLGCPEGRAAKLGTPFAAIFGQKSEQRAHRSGVESVADETAIASGADQASAFEFLEVERCIGWPDAGVPADFARRQPRRAMLHQQAEDRQMCSCARAVNVCIA